MSMLLFYRYGTKLNLKYDVFFFSKILRKFKLWSLHFFFFSKKKLNNYKRIHLAYIWNFLELYKMIPTNNMTIDSSNALEGSLLSCME